MSVKESLQYRWNIGNVSGLTEKRRMSDKILFFQNCVPRPQGPIYPLPDGEGNPHDNVPCDVVSNSTYITGYRCSGQCQTDNRKGFI